MSHAARLRILSHVVLHVPCQGRRQCSIGCKDSSYQHQSHHREQEEGSRHVGECCQNRLTCPRALLQGLLVVGMQMESIGQAKSNLECLGEEAKLWPVKAFEDLSRDCTKVKNLI